MWNMIWPILVVVLSNTFYNICQKSTPANVNAFGTLMVTYLVAAILTGVLFVTTVKPQNVPVEITKINWTAFVLGMAIVGLEVGYVFIYRAGWKVSSASVIANIALACVLIIVGALLYKEVITIRQLLGMAVCIVGLILITK